MSSILTTPNRTGPGSIPDGWEVANLEDICQQHQENVNPSAVVEDVYVGLEHIEPGNSHLIKWGRPTDVRSGKTRFRPGDILYGKLRPYLDKAVVADRSGICSTDILVFRCRNGRALPEFLIHAFHTREFVEHAVRTTHGVNHPRTSWASLRQFELGLPPLNEQRRIARVLATIQRAMEAQDKVIAAARELKRSLMKHLFTYGPVPVTEASRVPLKETEIGPVPEHWETIPFGLLVADGPQNGLYKPQSLYGVGTPIIRINDYENEGGVVTRAENRVQLTQEEVATFGLRRADILVNRVNSLSHLGKTALVGEISEPTVFESNMMRFAVDTARVLPEYAFRFLCTSSVREHFRGKSKRAVAQSSINQQDVRSLPTPLPSLREQHDIVASLSAVEQKIAAEEKRKTVLQALFKSMLHHLMTGKIRVPAGLMGDAAQGMAATLTESDAGRLPAE